MTTLSQRDSKFSRLANAMTRTGYEDFLPQLAHELANILDVEYVMIARIADNDNVAETLAVSGRGKLLDNFSYPLTGTPCETIPEREPCQYQRGVAKQFPDDLLLADLGVESYFGMPIVTSDGRKIGLIGAMSTSATFMDTDNVEILRIAAAQVGSELELSSKKNHIQTLTYEDEVTGLPNRQQLREYLRHQNDVHTVLLVDLRRFKDINDLHSHSTGDTVLYAVADRLQSRIASRGFIARFSSDEFAIVPNPRWQATVEAMAAEIDQWFYEPINCGQHEFFLDICMGAAKREPSPLPVNANELLRKASVALAEAKVVNCKLMLFAEQMVESLKQRQRLFDRFLRALRDDKFSLHFQPQVALKDGAVVGAEALCRWYDEDLGWVSPAEFIPLAEERGLMPALGDWVLQAAVKQLKDWQAAGSPLPGPLSINISNKQLESSSFCQRVLELTQGIAPDALIFELTESAVMRSPETNIKQVNTLKDKGFRWAIDDFGTGYSSLSYLTRLRADVLKIDRSFVARVPGSQHDESLIKTIIAMANSMQMKLVAEGIEHPEQAQYLHRTGCEFGQGYYFSHPLPAEAFFEKIRKQ